MARRALVSVLWFACVYLTAEVVWSIAATPRALNLVLGLGVAAFIFADPLRQFHPRSQPHPTVAAAATSLTAEAQFVTR